MQESSNKLHPIARLDINAGESVINPFESAVLFVSALNVALSSRKKDGIKKNITNRAL